MIYISTRYHASTKCTILINIYYELYLCPKSIGNSKLNILYKPSVVTILNIQKAGPWSNLVPILSLCSKDVTHQCSMELCSRLAQFLDGCKE